MIPPASQNHLKILFALGFVSFSLASLLVPNSALSQIIPDSTVGTGVIPIAINKDLVIGGTTKGANLFQSFTELNIAAGRGLYFNNPAGITNIFARVTGGNPSNILGQLGVLTPLGALSTANLFLLNPNGVIFGKDSSLALGGSLYVTTSDRVRFADGTTFSTNSPEPAALLTSSVPVGLGFGNNTGVITVRSETIFINPPLPAVILSAIRPPSGLVILPNTAIALVGSAVNFENNGSIFALGSVVELGGVKNGEVALIPNGNKFAFSYANVNQFGNVQLSGNASVNNIGVPEGNIKIVGDRVSLLDRSLVFTESLGNLFSSKISVQANQLIELVGSGDYLSEVQNLTSPNPNVKTINGFFSVSAAASTGGDISLEAPRLSVRNSSFIASSILFDGKSGNIIIKAPQSTTLDSGAIFSGTTASSSGSAANTNIQTGSLVLQNNSVISSTSLGLGQGGGDVLINATQSVKIFGSQPIFTSQGIPVTGSIITTTVNNAIAGKISVNTPFLSLQDGAILTTETRGAGQGGTLSVRADRIDLSGVDPSGLFPSAIVSLANLGSTGNGGNVNLTAKVINIQNGANVSVASFGTGNAGNLSITSDQLLLNQQGRLIASSISGEGGNINLQISHALILRNSSQILATSAGTGNSGNINIKAGVIVGLDNSQISANAFSGNGGNILINTQGLFFSPNSLITASSELGISGNVSISNIDLSTRNVSVPPTENFVKVDAIVSNSCLARRNATQGSFVVTGSGGLPENPDNLLVAEYPASTIQSVPNSNSLINSSINPSPKNAQKDQQSWQLGDAIVELRGLVRAENGEVLPVISYADAEALKCNKTKT